VFHFGLVGLSFKAISSRERNLLKNTSSGKNKAQDLFEDSQIAPPPKSVIRKPKKSIEDYKFRPPNHPRQY
jgi:hypothetical protein